MMNIFRRRAPRVATIEALYGAIVAQARDPAFYRDYRVPDTVNGRLDLLMLHLALAFARLAQGGDEMRALGQELFDRFCRDMDDHMREDGISDLKVPKEMRKVAAAFFGRHGSYLAALKVNDCNALEAALRRNVYQETPDTPQAPRLAAYVVAASQALAAQDIVAVAARPAWPDPAEIPDILQEVGS
jgi:cytochrome b pre-mRNA-processing protein 3